MATPNIALSRICFYKFSKCLFLITKLLEEELQEMARIGGQFEHMPIFCFNEK